jgi:hypothetical protein
LNTYSWLGLHIAVWEACCPADISERQFDDIVLRVVVGDIAISTKQIGTGDFTIIIEDFFPFVNRLNSLHDQTLFFLEKTGLDSIY